MAFCSKCGNQIADGSKFCDKCGASVNGGDTKNTNNTAKNISDSVEDLGAKIAGFNNTSDYTSDYDKTDIDNNKAFAVLAYLGILILIPILAAPNSKFARFHSNQGLVFIISSIAVNIVVSILRIVSYAIADPLGKIFSVITGIVAILILVIGIIGIVNAAQGKAKELPLIGKIRILK